MKKQLIVGIALFILLISNVSGLYIPQAIDPTCFYTTNGCEEEKGCYSGINCEVTNDNDNNIDDSVWSTTNTASCSCGGGVSRSWVVDYVEQDNKAEKETYISLKQYDELLLQISQIKTILDAYTNGYTEIYTKAGITYGYNQQGILQRIK